MDDVAKIAAGLTCDDARDLHGDDLPRFMATEPTIIHRSYGAVNVTQADIDSANAEVRAHLERNDNA